MADTPLTVDEIDELEHKAKTSIEKGWLGTAHAVETELLLKLCAAARATVTLRAENERLREAGDRIYDDWEKVSDRLAKAGAEVERVTEMCDAMMKTEDLLRKEGNTLRAEVERLTKERDQAYEQNITYAALHTELEGDAIALRAENEKLRAENGLLMAENRTESERLKEACDGYLGHAAGLRDEVGRLNERIRFADQEFAAECAGLRGEVERLRLENGLVMAEVATLRAENERLRALLDAYRSGVVE
jgi:chromosome segregation ATPase